jgi:predicted negative regulator of RcsB-dependent stress response
VLGLGKLDEGLADLQAVQEKFPEWHDSVQHMIDQVLEEKNKRESAGRTEPQPIP